MLNYVGVYLRELVFLHGHLYVALSRAKIGDVKVFKCESLVNRGNYRMTKNIVFPELLLLINFHK